MHTYLLQHFFGGGMAHRPLFQDTHISFLTISSVTFCFLFFLTLPESVCVGLDLVAEKDTPLLCELKPL